ncbi:MAG: hypothetical protein AAGA46_03330 [Cyanobacteria bacterium P01_F01_bin.13]
MRPSDHLLITEIPTGRQHEIYLSDLRQNGPIRFGRLDPFDEDGNRVIPRYIQLGVLDEGSDEKEYVDAHQWISKWQCNVFADPRDDEPGKWDYYLQDGAVIDGRHIPSSRGIHLGSTQLSKYNPNQLRPGPGRWMLFKKLSGAPSGYHCILEWPGLKQPGDDTNQEPPTLQEYKSLEQENEEIKQRERVFRKQAKDTAEQVQRLGQRMIEMQENFRSERQSLEARLNDQNNLLFEVSKELRAEQELNRLQGNEQELQRQRNEEVTKQLNQQKKRNRQVKLALVTLGMCLIVVAVVGFGFDSESMSELLNWIPVLAGMVSVLLGTQVVPAD